MQATTKNCKVGSDIRVDGGFTCIAEGAIRKVKADQKGPYFDCEFGKHYLDSQEDDHGNYIGVSLKR